MPKEITYNGKEITYTLHVTNDMNVTYQIGKELKSPKLIVSALNKTAYPPDFTKFTNVHFIKHTKTVISEIQDIDIFKL